jgi:rod shape-determining protein MreB and related proteins
MSIYYMGVDVGTSRSSVATSTGKRFTIDSCIGYPKDVVARKRLGGREYLLGKDALENRLALDIVYPLGDGVLKKDDKSLKGMHVILKDLIHHVFQDLSEEDEIYAAVGTPAQASIEDNKALLQICSGVFKRVLIVSEPFAISYGADIFEESLIIDIGAGTVDLLRVTGSFPKPEDQRSLTTAGNFLDETITKNLLARYPEVQITKNIIKQMKEKLGYCDSNLVQTLFTFTVEGKPRQYDVGDILQHSVREMVKPMCEAVQQLVATFDPEFQAKLRNNIVIAGGGSRLRGIDRAIEGALKTYGGGSAKCTEDPEFGGAMGALKMALEMPDDLWEKLE